MRELWSLVCLSGLWGFVISTVGLILQGLLDPRGDDWPRAAQDSVAMFIEAIEKE